MHRQITLRDHLFLLGAFLIMGILYFSSSQTYEEQTLMPWLKMWLSSKPFEDFLNQFSFLYGGGLISISSIGYFAFIEFFIRKMAHFLSYMMLGLCWSMGLRKRVREPWLCLLLAILLSGGYASFDELRQIFQVGRTGLMQDVILDFSGAVAGVFTSYFVTKKG